MANSFNQSSTGTDIEFMLYYDIDLASIYYDEFVDGGTNSVDVLRFGSRQVDYIVVCDDKDAPHYNISKLKRMKKQEVYDLYVFHELPYYYNDIEFFTKDELISDLQTVTRKSYWESYYNNTRWYDLECDFVSRGYSQGDPVKFNNLSGVTFTEEYITNILWDAPVSMVLSVNDEEVASIYDLVSNCYKFDEDEFTTNLEERIRGEVWADELMEFVKENMEIKYL